MSKAETVRRYCERLVPIEARLRRYSGVPCGRRLPLRQRQADQCARGPAGRIDLETARRKGVVPPARRSRNLDPKTVAGLPIDVSPAAVLDSGEASDGTLTVCAQHPGGAAIGGPGDCGAIWMTSDSRAVALHYGTRMSDRAALAISMCRVRDTLALLIP